MSEIGVYTPEQARELWQWYQSQKQLAPQLQKNYPQRRPIDEVSPHRVFVRNDSGETCPAYGCMQITGVATVGGRTAITISKPTTTDGEYLFNSQFSIANGACGWAYRFGVVVMLGNPPGTANATYLPTVAAWTIEEGDGPFIVFGEYTEATGAIIGRFAGTASTGAKWIRFDIVSSDPSTLSAIVNIRQRSFTGPAYGSSLDDTVIDSVYDTAGCYLNEINVELTGRSGFAMLMLTDQEAIDLHFGGYTGPEWYWMVTGICCPSLDCT